MPGRRLLAFVLVGLAVSIPAPAAEPGITMTAHAGLDGLVRPGRWTTVRVTIEAQSADVTGHLVAEWGGSRIRRAVEIAAPSRREFSLALRTGDARDVIYVSLESNGRTLNRIDVPVRIVTSDEQVTVCAGGAAAPTDLEGCAAVLEADALPGSWRSYDVADRVVLHPGVQLTREQRDGVAFWREVRSAETDGRLLQHSGAVLSPAPPSHGARAALAGYVLVLAIVGIVLRSGRRRLKLVVIALVVLAWCGVVWTTGRSAPIVIRHSSTVQQFAETQGALIHSRGLAEFPTDGEFAVWPLLTDASLDMRRLGDEPAEEWFDGDGHPVIAGRFGFGAAQSFTLEATAADGPLRTDASGGTTRIVNVSSEALHDCELPAGFAQRTVARLGPGESLTAPSSVTDDLGSTITCRSSGSPVTFSADDREVVTEGATIVVYHLASSGITDDPR